MRAYSVSTAVVVALLVGLSGCGFKLKGFEQSESYALPAMTHQVDVPSRMHKWLIRKIGVSQDSRYKLALSNYAERSRPVTIGENAEVSQFQVTIGISWSLVSMQDTGPLLVDKGKLEGKRIFNYDQNNIAGSERQLDIVRRELYQTIIDQLARRLSQINWPDAS